MCVVRQSTVLIPCKYTHPQHEQVSAVEWLHEKSPEKEVRVSQDPAFEGRVELQADAGNCSLLLRDVNESDAGLFRFVLGTGSGRNWTNAQGIRLEVTDAEVEVKTQSDNVTEGDWIVFICGSCIPSMTVPTYIWKKDGHLHSQRHGENLLDLESVGLEDRGQYSCTMSGHEGLNSTSVNITVRPGYPPKSISVSISPSGEIVEGDSVILSCNSDAKPPAEISWYKGKTFLQSGDTYSISNIKSEASGNYYCSARNKYGSQSSAAVNVMYPPKSVSVSINPSGEIVSGDSVTLNCSSDSNPPALNFSWFKEGKSVGSGRIFSISNISSDHSGEYKCRSRNKHGEKNSDTVMLNVMYPPKSVSVSISPSGEIVSGDSVTLNCSSDSKPPAEISWFKGGTFLGSGDTYSISNIKSEASGNYYCSARNKHGSQSSAAVTVNVMYPPKSVSVSINPSGEIVSGDSVTLNCSSDSNPPALNFSWFKEGKSVGSGRIFSISNISSDHSGEYKCRSRNKHGEKNSDTVMLNVMYPLKSVSVSISPSGEIVSGDSVTLNCSSDSNPPALNFSWFKGGTILGSGDTYSISNIKSEASGNYYCSARNKHGSQSSAAVTVNVMYPPKSVSVSINPSGEIVSGDSVTLNCSSDSNPPALNFSWFKEGKSVGSGRIFSISNISSDHSGEYKCRSRNKHGEKNSDTVMLNVMYPPKSVSVSISPSGEIVSGDSVTLNCSSDSNPPAEISWFKEDETSAVGSGQSFSISSFNSSFSGRFYCEAQNKYGSQRSASVSLTVKGVQRAALHTVSGIVAGCGGLIFIISIIIFIMSRMRREGETEDVNQKQTADASDDTYAALDPASRTSADIYSTIASVQSRAPDDTYTALELQSRSSEYETLAVTSADPH
ncbi:B-cell receptor CD22-like isoform X3 [Megalobrama amblycephala]|nr:B-cell receptor CD22-like isoform X3 [Megalobrama amblycephala]XP_048051841.1 B-cell receptor CD22-like isoform X3 [Megalobrama amblycephala]